MCSVGSSKDIAAGASMNRAIGGAQGIGSPAAPGSTMLGAKRVLGRPNTVLGGQGGTGGAGGAQTRRPSWKSADID